MLATTLLALSLAVSVVDGDTITVGGETIRIANIDAPETGRAKCDAERRLGKVAARRTAAIIAAGPVVLHRGDPTSGRKVDRYGRTLATVSVNGKDVGETLVAEGLARRWEGKRRPWCEKR